MIYNERETKILNLIRERGPLSRWELHQLMKLRPNTVGDLVQHLVEEGILWEGKVEQTSLGRPRVPLEISPERRHVIGMAIIPGVVEYARLNLLGKTVEKTVCKEIGKPERIVKDAAKLLKQLITPETLGVGVGISGLVSHEKKVLIRSSVLGSGRDESVQPLFDAASGCPFLLRNTLHAFSTFWEMSSRKPIGEDNLIVLFGDGYFGSSILVGGKSYKGCVEGGNELGHTAFPVKTSKCYCGKEGCLERIVSTSFLKHAGSRSKGKLKDVIAAYDGSDKALNKLLDYLALGLANAVNLVRPNRLVLASTLLELNDVFTEALLKRVRSNILDGIDTLCQIEIFYKPDYKAGEAAAWLALADLHGIY